MCAFGTTENLFSNLVLLHKNIYCIPTYALLLDIKMFIIARRYRLFLEIEIKIIDSNRFTSRVLTQYLRTLFHDATDTISTPQLYF